MKTRSILSVLIILSFLFINLTGTVSAAPFIDIHGNPHRDAIEAMTRLGILEGVGDNRFAPDMELNRAAAAKVAAFLMGYTEDDAIAAADWNPMFTDVYPGMGAHEWAIGWINLMATDEIIIGMPGGDYRPGDPLQMVQWAAILTRILGHETDGMAWPADYDTTAANLGLTGGLEYLSAAIMNRAEMARMTSTAIFDVERADGDKIIDVVDFEEIEYEPVEDVVYADVDLEVSLDRQLLPAGGGQTATLTARALRADGSPAVHTLITFFAGIESPDHLTERSNQLSTKEVLTDATGRAQVTYTTLPTDDDEMITLKANVPTPTDWIDRGVLLMASDTAAMIGGRLLNPFTGDPLRGSMISFATVDGSRYVQHDDATDAEGRFDVVVLPGTYHMALSLDLPTTPHHDADYEGSHSVLRADGSGHIRIELPVQAGERKTVNAERGILRGSVSSVGSHPDLYITRQGSATDTVAARLNPDGSFMIALPDGTYDVGTHTGATLRSAVTISAGSVTDVGNIR